MIAVYKAIEQLQAGTIAMENEGHEVKDVIVSRRLTYELANSQTVCCQYHELVWTVLYQKKDSKK